MASGEAKKPTEATTSDDAELTFARVASVEPGPKGRMVALDRIIVRDRLRQVRPAAVEAKRVSMRESGQISPIMVRPAPSRPGWYVLVIGAHRVEAARLEGWSEIEADIRQLSDDEAQLIEVDENLISEGLTPLDRAAFIEVRLLVWARLHPDRVAQAGNVENISTLPAPKKGRPAKAAKFAEFLNAAPPAMGFSEETAADIGLSRRTVENAMVIARGLSADARARLSTTKLAKNEGVLRQLAGVADKEEQLRVVEALVTGKAKTVGDALVIANGRELAPPPPPRPADEVVNEFKKIWKKAPASHRTAILAYLQTQPLPGAWSVTDGADD